jgi:bifunctional DNA-binding transcriptional regulator/antitoxin component of YhaV-PrlF toxin-antitoxin module
MVVKLDSKRRLTLPKTVTSTKPGDAFEVSFDAEEQVVTLRRISKSKKNWFEILQSCPVRLEGDLPPRSREYFKSKL